jgi:hypothetical protein
MIFVIACVILAIGLSLVFSAVARSRRSTKLP